MFSIATGTRSAIRFTCLTPCLLNDALVQVPEPDSDPISFALSIRENKQTTQAKTGKKGELSPAIVPCGHQMTTAPTAGHNQGRGIDDAVELTLLPSWAKCCGGILSKHSSGNGYGFQCGKLQWHAKTVWFHLFEEHLLLGCGKPEGHRRV